MKRILGTVLGLSAIVVLAYSPIKAHAATASAAANTTIVAAIAIAQAANLRFGSVAAGSSIGTVVMTPAGGRSKTGGVTLSNVDVGGAASFNVTGYSTSTYAITLPAAALTIVNGANNMTVDTWTSTPSGTGALTAGAQTLTVGGTMHVGVAQAAGTYTGNFDVTVEYN